MQSGAQRTRLLHDSPFLQGFDSGRSYTASRNATRGTDLHDWKLSAVPRTLPVSLRGSCRWEAIAGLRRLLVSRETSFWASEDQWTSAYVVYQTWMFCACDASALVVGFCQHARDMPCLSLAAWGHRLDLT